MDFTKRDEDCPCTIAEDPLEALTASSVANLMREQDAELLASHHALGVNDTPVQTSCEAPMIRDVPNLMLNAFEESPFSRPVSILFSPDNHDNDNIHPTRPSNDGTAGSPPFVRRPTLSGQIFLMEEPTPVPDSENLPKEVLVRKRTESIDRRLSEAAQFAAVVGEVADEIRIIEDHDDDDDDDDDDNEKNQRKGNPCRVRSVTSSVAPPSSVVSVDRSLVSSSGKPPLAESVVRFVPSSANAIRPVVGRPIKPLMTKRGFLDKLPMVTAKGDGGDGDQPSYVYKGIHSNPPEIVSHGIQRGNYAQLHRKAWLEVSDKYHRYGKNLRLYYRHWERLDCPYHMFFDWLDSKGEAAGQPLPELEECPRAQLDADTVLYITNPDVTERYALGVVVHAETGRGRIVDADGDPVRTGSDGWIFVLRDNRLYGAQKITSVTGERSKQRFHHSSFFGGKAVEAAGIFVTDDEGYLTQLLPHSGHYRPGEADMQRVLFFLYHQGIDLRTFEMDMQQILHVAREIDLPKNKDNHTDGKIEKKKKLESLCLQPAVLVACFLAHKARFIGEGIFKKIHMIRNSSVTNVTEALELIDDGGCW